MRTEAIYSALLRCYPLAFRDEYGDEMRLMFAEQLVDARRDGGRLKELALWAGAAADAVFVAPREHCHVILQDLRYAVRTMMARPGFTAVAIISLALGIGANTAIFSLWHGVLRAALPVVQKPDELLMLTDPGEAGSLTGRWESRTDGPRAWVSYAEFEQLRDNVPGFASIMASQSSLPALQARVGGGAQEPVRARLVSGAFFHVLGGRAALGRVFTSDVDRADTSEAVISHAYWQRRFGGREDVLGETLTIRQAVLTIVGVAAPGFVGETNGQQPDTWIPLRMQPSVIPGNNWLREAPPDKSMWLHVFARLAPGVTAAQAEAQANRVLQSNLESFYGAAASGSRRQEFLDQRLQIRPGGRGASTQRGQFSSALTALMSAVGILLLIACANLANLLLARGAARRTEMMLRLSLGAGRGRLMRQLVTESLALALLGGIAAIAVAYTLHRGLVRMLAEADNTFARSFSLDPVISLFLVAATIIAALLFGLLPAWQATRTEAGIGLKDHGRGAIGSRAQVRSGRILVGLQLALSLPLLVGAGLLARTAYNVNRVDLGFAPDRLLLARVDFRTSDRNDARRNARRAEVLDRLQRIPGVTTASYSQLGIFTGGFSSRTIEVEGYARKGDDDRETGIDVVGPRYFATLGAPIVLGRDLADSDRADSPTVCVINETFARKFFDQRNPVGMRITSVDDQRSTSYLVVGVARDVRTQDVRGAVEPRFFVPAAQEPAAAGYPTFLIRSSLPSAAIASQVRQAIGDVDRDLPIASMRTVAERMAPLTAQDRATAQLATVFGIVALALAAIGLYGVLAYGVSRRSGEIAIRIALGAQPGRVIAMILRETAGVIGVGVALGGALAYGASRLIGSQLYGVAPQDPATFAAATIVLLLAAASAAYLPARRASRLEPVAALRGD